MTLALAASLLLHAWAMHDSRGLGRPRVDAGSAVALTTRLQVSPLNLPPASEAAALPDTDVAAPPRTTAVAATATPRTTPTAAESSTTTANPISHGDSALPQPTDPTYYGALSLDVYPRAITPLDLGAYLMTAASGEVRATVLIDEAGMVNDVRAIDAADPEIVRAVRILLLKTRFTPARRDGRIVKAEVRVSLSYGKPH